MRLALALLLATPMFGAPAFTLDQVLGSPFAEGLIAAPRGDAVAWVLDAKGVRNIWVARAPGFNAAPVTRFTEDDGQELSDLAWAKDSAAVVFTRGGSGNGRGEVPNPRSNPAGVRQEVWIAPLNGSARKLGDGNAPTISPDGSLAVWISGGQIWSAALSGGGKPAQLVHARGAAEDPVWSPDGDSLAFRSNRGDHAFIGVYALREKALHFLDASVDRDQSPVWSPAGDRIAFIRLAASRYASAWGPKRSGEPWSIRIADVKTGKGRELFHAEPGMGSVFWPMVASNQLLWGADNRLVFPWEREGWLHLYSVSADGGKPVALTPGSFEIEHVALSIDGKTVIFSSNNGDIDRRHLWRVPVAGGAQQSVTPGRGIEWAPAPLAGGQMALLRADAKAPSRASIMDGTGKVRDLAPATMPADFPAAALVEPQQVIFPAADGMQIHGQLFLSANAGSGKHPAVIFFHGGSRRQMLPGWHYMFYYHQAYGFNQYLASKGYVVLSVNYRSGVGYGEQFREALNYGATGGSEYSDVIGAGLFMRNRPDVDGSRIGLWGGSYGGYLTALGLARASDMFAVGVDLHGVHEWNLEINNSLAPAYKPEERVDVARVAHESSPMAYIKTWRSPVLLIQGDDDRNVAFANTVQLAEALRQQGVYFEQLIFPDEVHDFLVHKDWMAAYTAADEFLGRYLKP
ncbi:MAG TPA: prolyl oligopeptidase family serine peptidase [Bryobacteraceae bacterium]|nr:prolyl oligopeptidase family serine peptidase [Bryobacteraceae bacterium]